MGIFGKIGDNFQKIDYYTSNSTEIVRRIFEEHAGPGKYERR